MKTNILLFIFLLSATWALAQRVAINSDGSAPNAGAMLDISSNTKGFLLPRMTTAQRISAGVLAKGMMVFDTDLNSPMYSNGTSWDQAVTSSNITNHVWGVSGTGGTNPGTNFIGNIDSVDLIFRTNNVETMRLTAQGDLGIGITPSSAVLHTLKSYTNASGSVINNYFNSKNTLTLSGTSAFTNTGGSRIDVSSSNTHVSNVIKGEMITLKTTSSAAADSVIGLEINLNNSSTGTTNIEYGIKVSDISPQNGTLTNTVGLYIGDVTNGIQTNNAYAIYSADANAKHYFAGKVGVGTPAPLNRLDVSGASSIGVVTGSPTNGLSVSGHASIGTSANINRLDVSGSVLLGSTFVGSGVSANGLAIEGQLGIGTVDPLNKLDVVGGVAIGATYSGTTAAPTNGLIVQGNTGIGDNTPGKALSLNGDMQVSGTMDIQHSGYQIPVTVTGTFNKGITAADNVLIGTRNLGFLATLPLASSVPGKVVKIATVPTAGNWGITGTGGNTVVGGGYIPPFTYNLIPGTGKTCVSDGITTWYCW
jgi:hypothetical protein